MRIEQGFFDARQAIDGEGVAKSASVPFFVFEAEGKGADEILAAVRAAAPARLNGLFIDSVDLSQRVSEDTYTVTVTYTRNEAKAREETTTQGEEGDTTEYGNASPAVSFDTTGGTRHITQSLSTVGRYPANAINYGGAIGVDGDGNVNGVDITMPVMTFSETHYFKPARVSLDFQKRLFMLTGTVNNKAFRGFAAGEVLFQGVSARRTGTDAEDLWELTYTFAVSPNQTEVKISENITVATKAGWDYVWLTYSDGVVNGTRTRRPKAAYVERVYRASDFADLGINTEVVLDE